MALIKFNFKGAHTGSVAVEVNDGTTIKLIPAALTVVVTSSNETDFTITTSTETINVSKKGNYILIDDINVSSQTAGIITLILQELFWQGTAKPKLLDLHPKAWLKLLPARNQTEIQLDPANTYFNKPFSSQANGMPGEYWNPTQFISDLDFYQGNS